MKQIIYIFVNLTAGGAAFKDVLMEDLILSELKVCTENPNKRIIIALIWLIINLTWNDEADVKRRIRKLTDFGFKKWLIAVKGTNAFINDKVITALENME